MKAMKWLSSIPHVPHLEHHTVQWIYLALGTKGLNSENNETFDDKPEQFISDIRTV
jgi:desulfoferrodoxin (superoxide reductase-like protein)